MRTVARITALAVLCAAAPSLAFAQRFGFDRTIQISGPTRLDVSTDRGKIEILPGPPGRIIVEGAATVRVGWNVPVNAVELAQKVAAAPPITHEGGIVRLRIPTDPTAQRAVTVNYRVQVPPDTQILSRTESGDTSIRGVSSTVDLQTQSARITISDLGGPVQVSTGSGAVTATDISGALSVSTSSSGFKGSALHSLRLRTQSGDVNASLKGSGDVDVETGSSAITLDGLRGGLSVKTQSGQIKVQGAPGRDWRATTGSSSVTLDLAAANFTLDLASRSGNVTVAGGNVNGSVTKHSVKGTAGGGPTVMVRTGSGAIRVQQ